jgi:hypothetical protein
MDEDLKPVASWSHACEVRVRDLKEGIRGHWPAARHHDLKGESVMDPVLEFRKPVHWSIAVPDE